MSKLPIEIKKQLIELKIKTEDILNKKEILRNKLEKMTDDHEIIKLLDGEYRDNETNLTNTHKEIYEIVFSFDGCELLKNKNTTLEIIDCLPPGSIRYQVEKGYRIKFDTQFNEKFLYFKDP